MCQISQLPWVVHAFMGFLCFPSHFWRIMAKVARQIAEKEAAAKGEESTVSRSLTHQKRTIPRGIAEVKGFSSCTIQLISRIQKDDKGKKSEVSERFGCVLRWMLVVYVLTWLLLFHDGGGCRFCGFLWVMWQRERGFNFSSKCIRELESYLHKRPGFCNFCKRIL